MSAVLFAVGIIRYMRLKRKLKTYYTSYMNN
jgi:hypothetical protein